MLHNIVLQYNYCIEAIVITTYIQNKIPTTQVFERVPKQVSSGEKLLVVEN
jgi:hypothetical protein